MFRAFQSNLLSLISHELRTPLMGILNALGLLEEEVPTPGFAPKELVTMARQNAQRLHHALASLLDLASLDSGTFHARLREVDLRRLVRNRIDANHALLRDRGIKIVEEGAGSPGGAPRAVPVLADAQKLGRALDLCLHVLVPRVPIGSAPKVRISSSSAFFSFQLEPELEGHWDKAWNQACVGARAGGASPVSAFGGVMQSEQAFLSRMEEGLGSEFLLIHEIARLHQGEFRAERDGRDVTLILEMPELSSEEGLKAVLASRAYEVSTELKSVALALLRLPPGVNIDAFADEVKKSLFRASDAVYALPARGLVALVLDDCRPEDAPRLIERISAKVGVRLKRAGNLIYGLAQCPVDCLDPSLLMDIAQARLSESPSASNALPEAPAGRS